MKLLRETELPMDLFDRAMPSYRVIWRPDSSGFFAIADYPSTNLYAIDLLSGDFRLVETNYSNSPNTNYAWINP
jgi:hypothetical protein